MAAVKTAISIDKALFDEMEELSQRLGLPRSQLYARAVDEFIRRQREQSLVEKLDQVYSQLEPEEAKQLRSAARGSFKKLVEGTW